MGFFVNVDLLDQIRAEVHGQGTNRLEELYEEIDAQREEVHTLVMTLVEDGEISLLRINEKVVVQSELD